MRASGMYRYPTAGSSSVSEAQPFYVNSPMVCLVHNGNLTNSTELKDKLFKEERRHLNTNSGFRLLLNIRQIIWIERINTISIRKIF